MKTFWVYIMSNKSRRLYVGFTSNLIKARIPAQEQTLPRQLHRSV
jgi:predicted GIY-YIG superfamily endonuclease